MSKPKAKANKRRPAPRPATSGSRPSAGAAGGKRKGAPTSATGPSRSRADQAQPRRARNRAVGVGVAALLVAVAALAIVAARQRHDRALRQLTSGGCRVDSASDPGGEHVAAPTYRVDPPSGGDHLSTAAPAGFYEPGQAPADGAAVHSLQHGYVDIWYRPGLDQVGLDGLHSIFNAYPRDVLILPHPSLQEPVAATAWQHRLLCGSLDTAALTAFVKTYRNQGPEKVPH